MLCMIKYDKCKDIKCFTGQHDPLCVVYVVWGLCYWPWFYCLMCLYILRFSKWLHSKNWNLVSLYSMFLMFQFTFEIFEFIYIIFFIRLNSLIILRILLSIMIRKWFVNVFNVVDIIKSAASCSILFENCFLLLECIQCN